MYYGLSVNFIIFLIAVFWSIIAGFGADETCKTIQSGRVAFLQVQLATFFLYLFWFFLPGMICKINDKLFKPSCDDDGNPLYGSWTHEQFAADEEDDAGGDDDELSEMLGLQKGPAVAASSGKPSGTTIAKWPGESTAPTLSHAPWYF